MNTPDAPPVSPVQPQQLHLVTHTHWDREWYKSAEAFRVHLLPLVEDVLARRHPFLMDGQAILLEDLLAWAPHLREPIALALCDGWLEAGPWYVLADNSICGGEALVRNLSLGRETLGELGAAALPVLYCPDTFGHPDAGPTLAAGFGLSFAITWRGYGGRGWPAGDLARWRNAAGDEVLMHHLPAAGYEYGSSLPTDHSAMRERWVRLRTQLVPRNASGHLLLLNGADHHAVQPGLDAACALLRDVISPMSFVEAGMAGYAVAVRQAAATRTSPLARGELRGSPGYVWTLGGTMGSRAHQKRRNAQLERLLAQEIEPLLALAHAHGAAPGGDALRAAWRTLLATHPHDTLCGCSIDDVALAMEARQREVAGIATDVRVLSIEALLGRAEHPAPSDLAAPLVVVNAVPRPRGGVVEATVELPVARVPIGFGSAGPTEPTRPPTRWSVNHRGTPCAMQRVSRSGAIVRDESPERYPRTSRVERHEVLLWAPEPFSAGSVERLDVAPPASAGPPRHAVHLRAGVLENGLLRVWWDRKAGLCCEGSHGRWTDLLALESVGDAGDLYTHSALRGTARRGQWHKARATMTGPLRGEVRCDGHVKIAPRVVENVLGERIGHADSGVTVSVRVQLDAGASWFRVLVDGVSRAHDYRLRLVVRAGIAGPTHRADAAFGPVERRNRPPEPEPQDVEVIGATHPLHRWVGGTGDSRDRGMTVLSDGLAEYEVTGDGSVAITLLRAVGELSRSTLPERPGHAGYPASVPLAQSEGAFTARFAILPHGADHIATRMQVERTAEDFLLPLRATPEPRVTGERVAGPHLEGEGLRWMGTRAGAPGALIVRCVNVTHATQRATLTLPGLAAARRLRLDDTPLGVLATDGDRVAFEVPPGATCAVELQRRVSR